MDSCDAMNLDTQDAVDPIIGDAEPRQDQVMARSKPNNNKNENNTKIMRNLQKETKEKLSPILFVEEFLTIYRWSKELLKGLLKWEFCISL